MRKNQLSIRALCTLVIALFSPRSVAQGEDIAVESERVTLAMILPALEGTDLGAIDLAPAPLPGESSVIRASDVKAKLKEEGRDPRGLAIPKRVRLVRRARKLDAAELEGLIKQALAARVAPCEVEQLSTLTPLTIGQGAFEVEADPTPRKSSGRTTAMVTLRQGERSQRISTQVVLRCPEPVVMPGAQVRLIAISGPVRVSAPGIANQPGRVGDEIRVTNQATKRSLKGRVIDAQSVEVIQ